MPRGRGLQPRLPAPFTGRGFVGTIDLSRWQALIPQFQEVLNRFEYGSPNRDMFLSQVGQEAVKTVRYVYENANNLRSGNALPIEYTNLFGRSLIHNVRTGPGAHQVRVSVSSRGVPYASYLETGTPPTDVDIETIQTWMGNKDGFNVPQEEGAANKAARTIQRRISREGTPAPYLYTEALDPTRGIHSSRLYNEVARLAEDYLRKDLF